MRLLLHSAHALQVRMSPPGGSAQPPGATRSTAGPQPAVTPRAPCEAALPDDTMCHENALILWP